MYSRPAEYTIRVAVTSCEVSLPATEGEFQRRMHRPISVTLIASFFLLSAVVAGTAAVSIAFSIFDSIWTINPRGQAAFLSMGAWAPLLLLLLSAACLLTFVGLWRGARWGRTIAMTILTLNACGDILEIARGDMRPLFGIPIVLILMGVLARSAYFRQRVS